MVIFIMAMTATGVENEPSEYAGSDACKTCHSDEYDAWKSSKHAGIFEPPSDSPPKCRGCHTTQMNAPDQTLKEDYVGCEACHGPGKAHIDHGGDAEKIVSSQSADICGRCHSGHQSDDSGWMEEYRPGTKLSDVPGLKLISVDPGKLPPSVSDIHPSLTYNMWLVSGHGKEASRGIQINGKDWTGPISCVACHSPHSSDHPFQMVMKPEDLCAECHFQREVQKGSGAKGIEETRSLHTPSPCYACHMTEGNHLMRVLRPDDPNLVESRTDSCSDCHEVKDRKMRAGQIQDWEAWYKETMEPIQADLKAVEDKLKKKPKRLNAEMKAKLDDLKANLSIIIEDGSGGVHNLDYALEIMSLAKRDLKKIKKAMR
jgi:predicted CXXCH cytochrome family protein